VQRRQTKVLTRPAIGSSACCIPQVRSISLRGKRAAGARPCHQIRFREAFWICVLDPRDTLIGAVTPADGNVISGNGFSAVAISALAVAAADA